MSKFSGLLSSAAFVGIIAFLIYLCCRTKRKGAIVQRAAGDNIQQVGSPTAGVINGYHPASGTILGYPQSYAPSPHEGYTPHFSEPQFNNGMANPYNNTSGYDNNAVYPPSVGGAGPFPMNPSLNTPYPMPMIVPGGMPMPQPVHSMNVQANSPYPAASAPASDMEDLPPPYHTVVGQRQ